MAHAELQWEQKTIQLNLHPLQVTGSVEFPFTNTGTNTVEILAVRTTCGCLKAKSSTNRVSAGESGGIDVTFAFHDKKGPQRKAVAVRVRDSAPVMLYVQANIPEVYSLSAERLTWALEEDYAPRVCRLVNQLKAPVHLISATASSAAFDVELKPVREGFEYEVLVSPKKSASPELAVITIQTECPPELQESRTYIFNAILR